MDPETRDLIFNYGVSNFIIFRRNTSQGPETLRRLCQELKEACSNAGLPRPIISVDQEGGAVQRLGPPFWEKLPSAHEAGNAEDLQQAITNLSEKTAKMLKDSGLNMNMAPVLDIAGHASSGVLRGRCFGTAVETVSKAGRIYIQKLQDQSIAAVGKHFPGIGMVTEDPHLKRPVVDLDASTVMKHAEPFRQAIESGVSTVMTSHVIFTAIDPDVPASFSTEIAANLLRGILGFRGVLITDDLEMGGITGYGSVEKAALRAFLAGHDMLLVCHRPERIRATVQEIQSACVDGRISTARLDASLERVENLRNRFCT
jgi:beta-N-acetylhexosaminidase